MHLEWGESTGRELNHLNDEQKEYTKKLIIKNEDRFYLKGEPLPEAKGVIHKIDTFDDKAINIKQYKCPIHLRNEMERQIQDLLDKKVIEPCNEPNAFNNPLWLVPKKIDSNNIPQFRLVADFRKLN